MTIKEGFRYMLVSPPPQKQEVLKPCPSRLWMNKIVHVMNKRAGVLKSKVSNRVKFRKVLTNYSTIWLC